MEQVADDVWLGTGTAVNWVVLREGGDLTLIDSGYPGDVRALEASIRLIGHRPEDVRAVLLTHAHVDHFGGLRHLEDRYGIPALMHPCEVPGARGDWVEQATRLDVAKRAWRPRVALWALSVVRAGALRAPDVEHAEAYAIGDGPVGQPLDLPGRPVPVHTAGHTPGHSAFLVPAAGALATGDALVTGHEILRGRGPQLVPSYFSTDDAELRDRLGVLSGLDADVLLPGHGAVWRGDPADAVAQALA